MSLFEFLIRWMKALGNSKTGPGVMKAEIRRKSIDVGVQKGTKARLSHSKFSMNATKDSVPQIELDRAPSNGSIFINSDAQEDTSNQSPESSTSSELKSTSSHLTIRNRSSRNVTSRSETSATESLSTTTKLKHHLEQVFIEAPLGKTD